MSETIDIIAKAEIANRRAQATIRRERRRSIGELTLRSDPRLWVQSMTASGDVLVVYDELFERVKAAQQKPIICTEAGSPRAVGGIISGPVAIKPATKIEAVRYEHAEFDSGQKMGKGVGRLALVVPVLRVFSTTNVSPEQTEWGESYRCIDVMGIAYDEAANEGSDPDGDWTLETPGKLLIGTREIHRSELFRTTEFIQNLKEGIDATPRVIESPSA